MTDSVASAAAFDDDEHARHLPDYDRVLALSGRQAALRILTNALAGQPSPAWLCHVRALLFRRDAEGARKLLANAVALNATDVDLRFALAANLKESNDAIGAEKHLREVLSQRPGHAGASFLLAYILKDQGSYSAVANTLRALCMHDGRDTDQTIQAIEILDGLGRQFDAAAICEATIAGGNNDARLYAYAGMLQIQLGQFQRARDSYLYAIATDARAFEWTIPAGLSSLQRYADASHPDFTLFRSTLSRLDIDGHARTSLLFALGKAHDDIGDFATAARYLTEANARAHAANPWSRKHWQRAIHSRLVTKPRPARRGLSPPWTPLFIVGVPRSGTTLVAELLSRYPDVRNRGELAALPILAQQLELASRDDIAFLERVTTDYQTQLLQDDTPARWYIDKEPLNLLRVDLIMAMYSHARIIVCQRNARDTALSLWSQHFVGDANGFAYDLTDAATVIKSCNQLTTHWQARYPDAVQVIRYEELIDDAPSTIQRLAAWLGLSLSDVGENIEASGKSISTGSVWQARQPVYKRSVQRWKHYAPFLPALLRLPGD